MALSPQGFFHNNNKQRESIADATLYLNQQEVGTEQASASLYRLQSRMLHAELNQNLQHTSQQGLSR